MQYRANVGALAIAASCLVFSVHSAQAADPPAGNVTKANLDEAQKRFRRARELYDENDFRAALVEMQRAYELAPNYKLLFDLGQIQYQLKDYPAAMKAFNRYLSDGGADISAARRDEVQKDIERLKSRVGTLKITTSEPGAEISIDDVSVGKTPLEGTLVSAGRRKVTATLAGRPPISKVIDVGGTDVLDLPFDFGKAPSGDEIPKTPPPGLQKDQGSSGVWVPWAITGALGVGTLATGLLTLKASGDVDDKLATAGITKAQLDEARSSAKTMGIVNDIFFVGTAIGLTTAIIVTASSGKKAAATATLRVGPGNVGLFGKF
jgi:hypothetical protein